MRYLLFFLLLFGVACGSDEPTTESNMLGESVYRLSTEGGNVFTCEACHALSVADDSPRRAGHPIGGDPNRSSFKNGQLDNFLDAVNSCRQEWMTADAWEEDDSEFVALRDFLAERGGGDTITYEIVSPPTDLAGDAAAGRETFNESCSFCHGEDGGGDTFAPPIAGNGLTPEYVAQRIRQSGLTTSDVYDGLVGGRMPFWAADRMSDDEVRNIATFISESDAVVVNNANNVNNVNNINNANNRTCDATHSRVGESLTLQTRFHDVAGTATVIDDCTIEVTNFTYDGTGIDVRFYNGVGSPPDYNAGVPLSGDLIRSGGYDNETFTITLPEAVTLDDVDGLSVWCVDVAVSFGDGAF